MKKIGIIGGGFTGTMTAVHLIERSAACEITIFNEAATFTRGTAYTPYSDKHLLNVITSKMSAYPGNPDHFLDWVMERPDFKDLDRKLIANAFMPRAIYGKYLTEVWDSALENADGKCIVNVVDQQVTDLDVNNSFITLKLDNGDSMMFDYCVIASGNNAPRNPRIKSPGFYNSPNYFQNPWKEESVLNLTQKPVLIVGNGLTMVDTVISLTEQGFKGEIHSISPNGFNILPHRHIGMKYSKLAEEIKEGMTLLEIVSLANKHIKIAREYGVSAEPVIDSFRPYTQKIWHNFSDREKTTFMSRLRHLWGTARHRIPMHSYEKLQKLQAEGRLHIHSGNLIDINENSNGIEVEYRDRNDGVTKMMTVGRIINCTGPESDFSKLESGLLKNCVDNNILKQDALKLGIVTDIHTYGIIGPDGNAYQNLFTIGGNLRGELWETTAVHDLREQAEKLSQSLASKIMAESAELIS
ncbi:hypothetical protein HYN59_14025 [Flavobacterium album]|uniref:FAD-dependent urate hydroxylase HpyO/Asp monooxygenase CreE-like FAD/NAD(P)-binding domain-containing protein n=1 Tax=Flavobacterium album TaxID=2175091 RepID=A0A2S1R0K0_9FLAO|nr:FAD/NAD(P)-binding protein [Flavobacterium album]AWH86156.1 hypothetical protein HYN59_14025 [Flavobacterium album]